MQDTTNRIIEANAVNWNNLTLNQQLVVHGYISNDLLFFKDRADQLAAKRLLITQHLLQLTDNDLTNWEKDAGYDYIEELDQVTEAMTAPFFENIDDNQVQVVLGLTKNPYPKIGELYGPKDNLSNISLIELATLFTLLERFLNEGPKSKKIAEKLAIEIIATAYRPAKPNTEENLRSGYEGDIRLPYHKHESTVEGRKAIIATLPPQVAGLIIFYITSCWHNFIKTYPSVFSNKNKKAASKFGWASVILGLSNGLDRLDKTSTEGAHTALIYLTYLEETKQKK